VPPPDLRVSLPRAQVLNLGLKTFSGRPPTPGVEGLKTLLPGGALWELRGVKKAPNFQNL